MVNDFIKIRKTEDNKANKMNNNDKNNIKKTR